LADDDVTVTSVNTYTSIMGISIEDKYSIKPLREKWEIWSKDKNCSLDGLKAL